MFALGIRYLQGIAVGSHGEHGHVEWPPHPARVFMAMVAAHYQTGADAAERAALRWLEELPDPPEIHAPDAEPCGVVTQYVPVNDDTAQFYFKQGKPTFFQEISGTSFRRNRQERTFARASLASDTVVLRWPNAETTPKTREALAALCEKVTRIGHSTSLVQMWLADAVPVELQQWVVDEKRTTHLLRVPKAGTLAELDRAFNGEAIARYCDLKVAEDDAESVAEVAAKAHAIVKASGATKEAKKDAKMVADVAKAAANVAKEARATAFPAGEPPQHRPKISTYAGYVKAQEISEPSAASGSVFSPHLVIFTLGRKDGPYRQLDLACTLTLTDGWRQALASQANDLSPEAQGLLTGHAPGGAPLQIVHVAFLPLAFVGHLHADGRLPGVALALPESTSGELRSEILRAAARVCKEGLKLGRLGVWKLASSTMACPLETLRAATWTAHPDGATQWSTVTPIAYDHHPKAKVKSEYVAEIAAMITAGCKRIGLPHPREVIVTPVSAHLGTPPSHAFPLLRRKDGSERRHTHAILLFDEAVRGPVIIGAGRYRGYGLCRPMGVES
jgi:CRISPR-associated protein Csb2